MHQEEGLQLYPTPAFPQHVRVLVHLAAEETLVGTCLVPLQPPGAETHSSRGDEKIEQRRLRGQKVDKMETIENWSEDHFGFLLFK